MRIYVPPTTILTFKFYRVPYILTRSDYKCFLERVPWNYTPRISLQSFSRLLSQKGGFNSNNTQPYEVPPLNATQRTTSLLARSQATDHCRRGGLLNISKSSPQRHWCESRLLEIYYQEKNPISRTEKVKWLLILFIRQRWRSWLNIRFHPQRF